MAARNSKNKNSTTVKNACRYCQKQFVDDAALQQHDCEGQKRRREQNNREVQLGYQAFVTFHQQLYRSSRVKTFEEFADSNYYRAFVNFGQYCIDIRAIMPEQYLKWLLQNDKKLDQWCRDSFYDEWLKLYIKKEPVNEALTRSLQEMESYAEGNSGLAHWSDYFRYGNANRICHHITTGRISPWVLYCSSSGIDFLESASPYILDIIFPFIDPNYWTHHLQDHVNDMNWCRGLLKQAGL